MAKLLPRRLHRALLRGQAAPRQQQRRQVACAAVSARAEAESLRAARSTWCNPTSAITRLARDRVWVAERPFIWNRIDVGGRMTILQLGDGTLLVHSPVNLDSELTAALKNLGPVAHVVSPNAEHVKFAQQWIDAFPDATSYACPGLREQEPDIAFHEEIGAGPPPPQWPEEVDVTFLGHEANPFTGKPFFNEILLHHKPSGALVTTDFYWNYPADVPMGTKLWKFGMDKVFRPFYFSFMIKDREAYRESMRRLFAQDWDMVVPCHGTIVTEDAKATLQRFVGHF